MDECEVMASGKARSPSMITPTLAPLSRRRIQVSLGANEGLERSPMEQRRLVTSGSPLEPEIGFSRAVRVGSFLALAGTAPIGTDGRVAHPGDVYAQTKLCLDIARRAIEEADCALSQVVRTRIMLTDIEQWRDAARAHGEMFGAIRPACTFVQVSRFIDPDWLVEIEADCVTLDS
jgi:enamine deaminase RidA (YjgF/YER057c/UK114 family)